MGANARAVPPAIIRLSKVRREQERGEDMLGRQRPMDGTGVGNVRTALGMAPGYTHNKSEGPSEPAWRTDISRGAVGRVMIASHFKLILKQFLCD